MPKDIEIKLMHRYIIKSHMFQKIKKINIKELEVEICFTTNYQVEFISNHFLIRYGAVNLLRIFIYFCW